MKKRSQSKGSDRRLASGKRPDLYLLSNRKAPPHLDKSAKWDPKHFRLFVGNLGPDATDDVLAAAFSAYPTISKAHVAVDKSGTSKGYGFVAFSSADDYLKAFREMNGKYVGQRPVQLKRADKKK